MRNFFLRLFAAASVVVSFAGAVNADRPNILFIFTDQALKWLNERDTRKPFFLMCQHKAPHGRWEPALRHLREFDDVEFPEPPTLFDDYSGRSAAPAGHKMGIADHMGPSRLMFRYSSKFTPEQFKVFDAHFGPCNEAARKAKLTGKERTRWNYQRYIKNYLADKPFINGDSAFTMTTDIMPRPYGPVADNLDQRAEWTAEFFLRAFARQNFVGWHYCGLIDASNLVPRKRSRQHSGLLDGYGKPYSKLEQVLKECADEIYKIATATV